jgi:hypothetical protein
MRISLTFLLADHVMLMRAQQRNAAVRNSTEKFLVSAVPRAWSGAATLAFHLKFSH